MKLFIASDIHGSAYYCKKLLEAYSSEKADRMLLLGDILYHGPRNDLPVEYAPKAVAAMLNDLKDSIYCVRGNCDTDADQMLLEFPIMADYITLFVGDRAIFATHGHKFNQNSLPPLHKGDILLHGHTHVPKCTEFDSYVYCNPGSVSIPKECSEHSYIILESNELIWKTLEGKIYMQYSLQEG